MNVIANLYKQCGRILWLGLICGLAALAGCPSSQTSMPAANNNPSAPGLQGSVYGGRQPISGATVLAYEMNASSGSPPTEIGSAVTDSSGNFTLTFSPTPTVGEIVYLVADGGNAGSGTNSAIALMTVAGFYCSGTGCPFPANVNIDELSTVASTAAMDLYVNFEPCSNITGNTQPSGNTCVALSGDNQVSLLFAAQVAALVNLTSGQASGFLTSQATSSPIHLTLEKLDSLADILAACVNSSGPTSSACTGLFGATLNNAGDTLTAAYDIATSPVINSEGSTFFSLLPASPVYAPVVTAAPANWTVAGQAFSYAANFGNGSNGGDVSAWHISTQAGVSLIPVTTGGAGACAGSPSPNPDNCFAAGIGPYSVAITPGGQFVYANNANSGNISAWAADPATGVLVPVTSGASSCGTGLPSNCFTDGNSPEFLATIATGNILYAVDGTNEVSAYSINASTGALTPISGSPFAAGNGSARILLDAKYGLAYVSNYSGNDISAYTINPATGALVPVTTGGAGACGVTNDPLNCFPAGFQPTGLATGPAGYLYAADRNCTNPPNCNLAGSISEWTINTTSGALTPISASPCGTTNDPGNCVTAGIDPYEVADVGNAYLYSANVEGNDISGYSISSSNGALTALTASSCNVSPDAGNCFAAVSPDAVVGAPHTLVVADLSNQISLYDVSGSGALTQASIGSQYSADLNTQGISIDPTDRYAYVTNGSGIIDQYMVDPLTGALKLDNTQSSTNAVASNLAIDPSGRYLYSPGGGGGNQVAAFSINPAGGNLNTVPGGSCGGGNSNSNCFEAGPFPQNASVDASGKYLYVANSNCATSLCTNQGSVSAYSIDSATGALTYITSGAASCGVSPDPFNCFAAGEFTYNLATDPATGLVYAGNAGSNNVSGYQINSGTGALTGVTGTSCGTGLPSNCFASGTPVSIALTPSGAFAYASNLSADSVTAFSVNSSTGVLVPIVGTASCGGSLLSTCFEAGNAPFAGAVTPNGAYYYVTNDGGSDVSAYSINATTGVLTPVTTGGAGACGVTNDPLNCFAAGTQPQGIAMDPLGRFVYIANRNCSPSPCSLDGYVSVYELDNSTGALTPLSISSPFPAGDLPFDVDFGP